jgi:hypothetical protein
MKSFFTKITIATLLLALLLPQLCACGIKDLFFSFRTHTITVFPLKYAFL